MFQSEGKALAQREQAQTQSLSAALFAAERTGQLPSDGWPAVRNLLLASPDPEIVAAVEPLRQLISARRTLLAARQSLDQGYAAVAAAGDDLLRLTDAAETLALLADDLAARARQLCDLALP